MPVKGEEQDIADGGSQYDFCWRVGIALTRPWPARRDAEGLVRCVLWSVVGKRKKFGVDGGGLPK